ncbi:unnamed protein product [Psylliodes chrysocephalus]|uniref:C-type lectin domain-containing protein n=1 Tax=Psylliodes chrysocephalus TaxID=3402493 RepID=A0A9P0G3W9_9CUCU|nr:unnamed protein product [Psylliodes chrysocephala]
MLFKAVFLLFVLNIFEVKPEEYENEHHEFVSAVLKKNKSDPNRFTFAGKHYYVANIFTADFYKAIQFCRQQKMQLLSINSKLENDRIGRFIEDNGMSRGHFWTSASNHGGDGEWVWLSTGQNIVYTNWYPGEPSGISRENNTENCIEARHFGSHGFTWNDLPCHLKAYFICESNSDCD